jgi:hypothetical protein
MPGGLTQCGSTGKRLLPFHDDSPDALAPRDRPLFGSCHHRGAFRSQVPLNYSEYRGFRTAHLFAMVVSSRRCYAQSGAG